MDIRFRSNRTTHLAEHYGFTQEKLDFIINYDIKYRMGKELENGDFGSAQSPPRLRSITG